MKDNRETVFVPRLELESKGTPVEPIAVTYLLPNGQQTRLSFTQSFSIGRTSDCDICIDSDVVSRRHARVYPDGHVWRVKDLGSANGTYLDGKPITDTEVVDETLVRLSHDGPAISLRLNRDSADGSSSTTATKRSRLLQDSLQQKGSSGYSDIVHKVMQQTAKKHSRAYKGIIAALSIFLFMTVSAGIFAYLHLENMAVDIFYTMKTIELQVAQLSTELRQNSSELEDKRQQLGLMATRYENFRDKLQVLDWTLDAEEKIILRVARILGECELEMPPGFVDEVKTYIRRWRATDRFETAIRRAQRKGYIPVILNALAMNNLPPQFFYLALQESNLHDTAVGMQTKWGIAKGMWQFIPATGQRYGLQTGPLVTVRTYDPLDERHDFQKSTLAAASYLRDIYTTDAQASGLLVMAAYNWGENRIIRLLRSLPENPRERNFWQLLQKHNVPAETYDYVLHIFSAAVIGENPKFFGFDFDNPLAELEATSYRDSEG